PVRAIPSSLAIKSNPTIPPPTDSYEPLVKAVLRHRLTYNILLQSGLLTWAIVTVTMIWQQNAASIGLGHLLVTPFTPLTLLASLIVWLFMALPIVIIRKMLMTSTRTTATSPASSLSTAMAKPNIRRASFVYIASAFALVVVHVAISYAVESTDPKLRIFVKSKKHPHYLNGRLIFLVISQAAIAIIYALRSVMMDRFAFKWSIAAQKSEASPNITLLDVIRAFIVATLLSFLALPVTAGVFAVARLSLPILYNFPLIASLLKPFTTHFLRGSWTILLPFRHIDLIRRAVHLGFVSAFIWETADTLFDLNVAKQIPVANLAADPNVTLISGISSSDLTFQYFAYSELCTLAEDKSAVATAQRSALFSDQKFSPNLWSRFIRESLLLLGKDYQLFLRHGDPEPPAVVPPQATPALNLNSITSSPVPLLRKRVFKSTPEGPVEMALDAIASDGPMSRAVDANVSSVDLPEVFRSAESKVIPQATKQEVQKGVENAKGVMDVIKRRIYEFICGVYNKYVPPVAVEHLRNWLAWWRNDRTNKIVEKSLPSRELDIIVVEVISRLTCASLTEDRYGVVQRDIPRILEAFLSFLSVVEERQVKVNSLYVPPKQEENEKLTPRELQERETLRYEVEQGGEALGAMADGLKEGIARIVRTFGDRLLAFKFPPRTAQKLQGFLDYC
ncbi:Nucleoporin NDC1, partial [Leucoagaricus sp. SymC.cos]